MLRMYLQCIAKPNVFIIINGSSEISNIISSLRFCFRSIPKRRIRERALFSSINPKIYTTKQIHRTNKYIEMKWS